MQFSARFSGLAHAERNGPDPRWVVHVGILAGLASRCQCSFVKQWGAAEPDAPLCPGLWVLFRDQARGASVRFYLLH